MKRISSKQIKKIVFGIMLSDGYIDRNGRLDLYNKNEEYILFVKDVLEQITLVKCHIYEKYDARFDVYGYRLTTNVTPYFKKIRKIFYDENGVKRITKYIVDRLDFESLAHAWMCDGYMYHAMNRKENKVQNLGYFCLEGFPPEELSLFIKRLSKLSIESRLEKVDWGFGFRPKISSLFLQVFIDNIFQYVIPCFKYKTLLYYKSNKYLDSNLQSAEQYVIYYDNIEDIVRHSQQ